MPTHGDPNVRKRRKFPKHPVVFAFQPTHYEIVPPEKLSEWEAAMRDYAGIQLDPTSPMLARTTETWATCGGMWDWDY